MWVAILIVISFACSHKINGKPSKFCRINGKNIGNGYKQYPKEKTVTILVKIFVDAKKCFQ